MTINNRSWFIIISFLVLVFTVPCLYIDAGSDGDAIRGIRAAENLYKTGKYLQSRIPGNPLFEYLLFLIVPWGGYIGSNIFVLLSFGFCVIGFYSLLAYIPYKAEIL